MNVGSTFHWQYPHAASIPNSPRDWLGHVQQLGHARQNLTFYVRSVRQWFVDFYLCARRLTNQGSALILHSLASLWIWNECTQRFIKCLYSYAYIYTIRLFFDVKHACDIFHTNISLTIMTEFRFRCKLTEAQSLEAWWHIDSMCQNLKGEYFELEGIYQNLSFDIVTDLSRDIRCHHYCSI